jgi:hypothetical protein
MEEEPLPEAPKLVEIDRGTAKSIGEAYVHDRCEIADIIKYDLGR